MEEIKNPTEATEIKSTETETVENQEVVTTEPEVKALDKNAILREMSKEYGVNLYSAEGLAEFKKYQDAKKSEQEKLQDKLNSFQDKETEHKAKEESYLAQIAALQLGIADDKLEDALALAKVNMTEGQSIKDGLAAVKAKYGDTFGKPKGKSTEVTIGTQQNESETNHIEVDEALARYLKNKK